MATRHTAASAFNAFAKLFKSDPAGFADAADIWNGEDQAADPKRVLVGPPQTASGSGLERFISEYANPTTQGGISGKYADFAEAMKEFTQVLVSSGWKAPQDTAANSASSEYAKAIRAQFRVAKAALVRCNIASISNDATAAASHTAKAEAALDTATQLIAKAAEAMEETADDDDMDKAADIAPELDRMIVELQALRAKMPGGKQDDSAPGARANGPSSGSLKSLTIPQLLDTVAGRPVRKSSNLTTPPDFAASAGPVVSMSEKIEIALDRGQITDLESLEAETLLQHVNLVKGGRIPQAELQGILAKASPAVQQLFGVVATAPRLSLAG